MRSTTIGAVAELFDGPHATPRRTDEGPYFLNISSLNNGRLDLGLSDHVSESDFAKWTKRVTPQPGDLLFSYETRLGEAALMPEGVRACLGRRMALLRFDRVQVDPRYFLYLYLSPEFKKLIASHTIHGATVNRIPLKLMPSWTISLPSLDYQRAIAEVLGALDDKIAANRRLLETAEDLAISLLESVPTSPLGDIVIHRRATQLPSASGARLVAHYSLPAFDATRSPEFIDPIEIKSSKFRIEAPSVLISKLNPRFPRVWEVPEVSDIPAMASTEFLVLEPKYGGTGTLWAALRQAKIGRHLESMVAGTSGSHQRVKPAEVMTVQVADPRLLEATRVQRVESLTAVIHAARRESVDLATVRDTLLPRLMSGELRVRDAEDVVSNVV